MSKKFAVCEILRILELENGFHRIDLNLHDLARIDHLLDQFLDDSQNYSPTFRELIQLALKHNGILECYITEPDRSDCRISCEGIVLRDIPLPFMVDLVNEWHGSDEFHLSLETNGNFRIRLWWD